MRWTETQMASYLGGIQQMLVHHHEHLKAFIIQWFNQADPVPLCGDIIVDVDGQFINWGPVSRKALTGTA